MKYMIEMIKLMNIMFANKKHVLISSHMIIEISVHDRIDYGYNFIYLIHSLL